MKLSKVFSGIILCLSCSSILSCSNVPKTDNAATTDTTARIERGKYLVNAIGCEDCHSPKVLGPEGMAFDENLRLSGHPASMPLGKIDTASLKDWVLFNPFLTASVGPWGISYAANLTPDATGIGNWTEEQFIRALREGKYKGMENGRPLLPPMPWQNFKQMTDDDIKSIFAYLKTVKPVNNLVPSTVPPNEIMAFSK